MAFTRRETTILLVGDFLILIASLWAALTIRNFAFPSFSYFQLNLIPFIPIFLLSLGIFYVAGLYEKQTRALRRVMGARVLGAQVANVIIAALLFFALPLSIAPKTILLIYLIVSVIAILIWRFYRMQREIASEGRTPAVLVGKGTLVNEVFEEVNANGTFLFRFVSHIDTAEIKTAEEITKRLSELFSKGVRIVVLDTRDPAIGSALAGLYPSMVEGVSFLEFSVFYEGMFDRVPLAHVDHAWLLECLPKGHTLYDATKRAIDIIFSLLALIIATPFIIVAALLLWLSGGPAFIRNERVGMGGKTITIFKMRTMLLNDRGDPELRAKNRITAIGKVLRKTRIDELPQLWNILEGDLSFIGPRPELPSIAQVYERELPYYQLRHLILPGLSGWAQINNYDAPKGGADVERTRIKLSYDLYYLQHRSFGLDLAIMLKTLRALASFSGQ